jgi:hypothetical protein
MVTIDWKARMKGKGDPRDNIENMIKIFRTRGEISREELRKAFFQRKEWGSFRHDKLVEWMEAVMQEAYEQGFDLKSRLVEGTRKLKYVLEEKDA